MKEKNIKILCSNKMIKLLNSILFMDINEIMYIELCILVYIM